MKPVSVKKSFILQSSAKHWQSKHWQFFRIRGKLKTANVSPTTVVKTSDIDLRDVNRLNARQIPVKIFEIFGLKIFEIFGLKIFENFGLKIFENC